MIGASNFSIPSFLAKILILCQFCSCAYFTFCILTKRIPSRFGLGGMGANFWSMFGKKPEKQSSIIILSRVLLN
jgi:hypothetical protein